MTRTQYLSFVALILSAFMFLGAFLYHKEANFESLALSRAISRVTSAALPDIGVNTGEVYLEKSYTAITRDRSIVFVLLLSVLLCVFVIVQLRKEKVVRGRIGIPDQLMAGSVMLIITVVATSIKQGMI